MKRNWYIKITACFITLFVIISSCKDALDLTPTNDITAEVAYKDLDGYKQVLAKVYGSFALTSSNGPDKGDLAGIDPGTSDFLRLYWNAQEITTDEAACNWNNPGVYDLNYMTWTSNNIILQGLYTRSIYQITVCNEFLRESTDEKLSSRGISSDDAATIRQYRTEARFLRAYQYWVLMDMFGNPPFITEADAIGKKAPAQIKRADLFSYIETELKAIEGEIIAAHENEYGRADCGAVWALLARLYINAEVYLGSGNNKYTDAITYALKVINGGYSLNPVYRNLFLADNDKNNPEVIFSINYDGISTQNFGGTTFLINAATNAAMDAASFGIPGGGWGGIRSRDNLPAIFPDHSGNTDKRAMFFGSKQAMEDIAVFTDGLAVTKFKNITSGGATAPSSNGTFCSTDFPLFRLAEMYLIYSEAVLRGGTGGNTGTALNYVNLLRERAFGNNTANLGNLTLSNILEERGRELYWEAFRRTDLIRFGKFTDASYIWPFKGGTRAGKGVEPFRSIFPIPVTDIISNPNLVQNPGY